RVPAGAIIAASALSDLHSPALQATAFLLGGGLALSSHGTKAAARAALNLSPEPVSNVVASIVEDVLAFGSTLLAVFAPVVMLVVIAVAVIVSVWLLPKIVRLVRRTIATAARVFRRRPAVG